MLATFFRQISIRHLWPLTVTVGIFVFVNTHPIRPHDFWWHMAIGREIMRTGKIPTWDNYSYTMPGQLYPSYQMFWLPEVSLYEIYRLGGPALVIFLHSLVITSAYGVVLWLCWKASGSWRIAAVGVLFAVALGLNDWNIRPQSVAFLLGAVYLLAIYSFRESRRRGWLVVFPASMLVWANSHGSFLIGLALLGIWLADELWRWVVSKINKDSETTASRISAPALSLSLAILACFVNPRGAGIISYLRTLTGNPVVQNLVPEWAPPTFDSLLGTLFIIGFFLTATVLAVSPKRPGFFQIGTFFLFGLLGFRTSRGAVWFGMAIAPILAEHLSTIAAGVTSLRKGKSPREGARAINLIYLGLLIGLALVSLPWFKDRLPLPVVKAGLISSETPVKATQFLIANHPPGFIFNEMSFGSYLIWAAQPDYPVFIDPRIELYPAEIWREYLMVINALPGWEERLEAYGVRTLMLDPQDQAELIKQVDRSANWRRLYADEAAVIYTRQD